MKKESVSPSLARAKRDRKAYRLIVAGSRDFDDYHLLCRKLDKICRKLDNILVISGGARGADKLGERWAFERGWSIRVYHPDYKKYGKEAPFVRNTEMADDGQALVAFWNGSSNGTKDMIKKARKAGLKVKIIHVETERHEV